MATPAAPMEVEPPDTQARPLRSSGARSSSSSSSSSSTGDAPEVPTRAAVSGLPLSSGGPGATRAPPIVLDEDNEQGDGGELGVDTAVRLHGLQGASHLNGRLALVLCWVDDRGRYEVCLHPGGEKKAVQPANLEPLSLLEETTLLRDRLMSPGAPISVVRSALRRLDRMRMTSEVLFETKIGKAVNNIGKTHANLDGIAETSKRLVFRWRDMFRQDVQASQQAAPTPQPRPPAPTKVPAPRAPLLRRAAAAVAPAVQASPRSAASSSGSSAAPRATAAAPAAPLVQRQPKRARIMEKTPAGAAGIPLRPRPAGDPRLVSAPAAGVGAAPAADAGPPVAAAPSATSAAAAAAQASPAPTAPTSAAPPVAPTGWASVALAPAAAAPAVVAPAAVDPAPAPLLPRAFRALVAQEAVVAQPSPPTEGSDSDAQDAIIVDADEEGASPSANDADNARLAELYEDQLANVHPVYADMLRKNPEVLNFLRKHPAVMKNLCADNVKLLTRLITRSYRRQKEESTLRRAGSATGRAITISNLPLEATESDVVALVAKVGLGSVEVSLARESRYRRSAGVAFAMLASREAAQEAISELQGAVVRGQRIHVECAGGAPDSQRGDRRIAWKEDDELWDLALFDRFESVLAFSERVKHNELPAPSDLSAPEAATAAARFREATAREHAEEARRIREALSRPG